MIRSTSYRLFCLCSVLFCAAEIASGGPVYEPIVGFRPTATSPGGSLLRHSDGSFYGLDGDLAYRVSPNGELLTFPRIPGLRSEARHLLETADGRLWGTRRLEGERISPNVFYFDPTLAKAKTVARLPAMSASPLTSDGLGFLWGTTLRGGATNQGTIYKIEEQSGAVAVMHSLAGGGLAAVPYEPLILHGDDLWGSNASFGGSIFAINAKTGIYRDVGMVAKDRRLAGTGPLSDDGVGNLWCITIGGAVVKVQTRAKTYAVVAEFESPAHPEMLVVNPEPRRLVRDGAGNMWGTTARGSLGGGSIFKVNIDTGVTTVIAELEGYDHRSDSLRLGELVYDGAGSMWGTTAHGGAPFYPGGPGAGSIIRIEIATNAVTTVADFGPLGASPPSIALVKDEAGYLWGTVQPPPAKVGGLVFRIEPAPSKLTIMAEFTRSLDESDGLFPGAALVSARDGNLWGVASEWQNDRHGFIYKVDPITWRMTRVVEFTGESGANTGTFPRGPLAEDVAGQLWGTLAAIGNHQPSVFKVDPVTGQLTRVSELPLESPVFGGLVYDDIDSVWGTFSDQKLFKVHVTTGELTIPGTVNSSSPEERLVSDGRGYLWGIHRPGSKVEPDDIFKIDARTGQVTKVFVFKGIEDHPYGLCSDRKGHLWGTVGIGPLGREPSTRSQPGVGAVFKLDAATGRLVYLHHIPGQSRGRAGVWTSPLTFDGADRFYGTTMESGTRGLGTIFTFTRTSLRTLVEFTGTKGPVPGAFPSAQRDQPTLVRHSDGNLYGSTYAGGILPDGGPAGGGQFYRIRFGPTPLTLPAEKADALGATLRGTINPNGATTTVSFEFGVDPELKTFSSSDAMELPPRNKPKQVSAVVSSLQPGQTYYFRVVGRNVENGQPQRGAILSFTTIAAD